jgi:hypothetical protein
LLRVSTLIHPAAGALWSFPTLLVTGQTAANLQQINELKTVYQLRASGKALLFRAEIRENIQLAVNGSLSAF